MEHQAAVCRVGAAVDDPQQGPGESEELKEAVETKVDEMSSQTHHLQEEGKEVKRGGGRRKEEWRALRGEDLISEFIFLLVVEGQLLVQNVVQVLLHEHHGVGEAVLLVVSAVVEVGIIAADETEEFRERIRPELCHTHTVR